MPPAADGQPYEREAAPDARNLSLVNDERLRALEILDAQEGTGPVPILTGDEPARLLARSKRIALDRCVAQRSCGRRTA